MQWLRGKLWRPGVTRLVTVTPEAKPDLAMEEEQPPVVGGASLDLPPSSTEEVTRTEDGKEEDLPSYATICEKI